MFRRTLLAALAAALPVQVFAQAPVTPALPAPPAPPALPGQDTVTFQMPPTTADGVKEVLALYERLTGRRLLMDNTVSGVVPITINAVPKDEAIKMIEIALLMNDFKLVPSEDPKIWKVLGPAKPAKGMPIYTNDDQLPETEQLVSFLYKLTYADAQEIAQTLGTAFGGAPTGGTQAIIPLPKAGAVLINENAPVVRQILRVIRNIDVKPAEVESRFFPLQRADAKDIQEKLTDILTKKDAPQAGVTPVAGRPPGTTATQVNRIPTTPEGLPLPQGAPTEGAATTVELNVGPNEENIIAGKIKITADIRTNRIHIVTRPTNMEFIAGLIQDFDANVPFGEPSVYPLRFVNASDIFQVVVKAISDPGAQDQGGAGPGGQRSQPTASTGNNLFNNRNNSSSLGGGNSLGGSSSGGTGGGSATLSESLNAQEKDIVPDAVTVGNSRVIADKRANAIIVVGNRDVKEKLFAVIRQLDVPAPQVMLHTIIGQLTLSESESFGVNYITNLGRDLSNFAGGAQVGGGNGNGGATVGNGSVAVNGSGNPVLNLTNLLSQEQIKQIAVGGTSGLSGFFTAGNAFDAIVTALETTTKFRVVSRPNLFTSNNKKAIISSGEEIAIPTTIQSGFNGGGTNNNNLVTNSSISFKTVALTLEVLPLINDKGEVSMDIVQKIDEQVDTTRIDNNDIPRIATRVLQTNVTVPNGATLVLGGLIKERRNKTTSGIPGISRLPLLGPLFRSTTFTKSREELVILIRPEVTQTPMQAVATAEREQEFLRIEPDLEQTLMQAEQRQRVDVPEAKLRQPAPPKLREYSGRPVYVKPEVQRSR